MEANLKADLRDNSGSAESRRLRNAGSLQQSFMVWEWIQSP